MIKYSLEYIIKCSSMLYLLKQWILKFTRTYLI
jgi:hypothetical protein